MSASPDLLRDAAPLVDRGEPRPSDLTGSDLATSTPSCDGGGSSLEPATCSDRAQNAGETDLDCGGPACRRCRGARRCLTGDDCESTRCSGGRCEVRFGYYAARSFQADDDPTAMAAADFDGDGLRDVAVTSSAAHEVVILLAQPGGELTAARRLPVVSLANLLVAADLDGDGRPDLAVASSTATDVWILRNQGGGQFAPGQQVEIGMGCFAIAAADFDADQRIDLVLACGDELKDTSLRFKLNLGNRAFGNAERPLGWEAVRFGSALVAEDLNGDGKAELVVAKRWRPELELLVGQGGGKFAPPRVYGLCGGAASCSGGGLTVGDLFPDGRPDLVAVAGEDPDSRIAVFRNRGDATFDAGLELRTETDFHSVATGDLDRDGRLDIAVGGYGTVGIARQRNNGTFESVVSYPVTSYGPLAFLERKGGPDLASLAVGVALLQREGAVELRAAARLDKSRGARDLIAADLDGDGRADLAAANFPSGGLSLWLTRSCGRLSSALNVPLSPVGVARRDTALALRAADLDRDGVRDLVLGIDFDDGGIAVMWGQGGGSFSKPVFLHRGNGESAGVEVADFDNDGRLDIAALWLGSPRLDDGAHLYLNAGQRAFRARQVHSTRGSPEALAAADLDGNGRMDLIVMGREVPSDGVATVLLNQGMGRLLPTDTYALPSSFGRVVAAADMNRDGRVDVLAGRDSGVGILLGQGGGKLSAYRPIPGAAGHVAIADLDGDGRLDLVTGERQVRVLLGLGDGTFRPPLDYSLTRPQHFAIADLDGDGGLDIATAGSWGVAVLHSTYK